MFGVKRILYLDQNNLQFNQSAVLNQTASQRCNYYFMCDVKNNSFIFKEQWENGKVSKFSLHRMMWMTINIYSNATH